MKVTIRDIAAQAGVSIGTVSRALKDQDGLSETTRQHVCAIAARLGYETQRLRLKRYGRLLFLVHRQHMGSNPFFTPVLQGVESACREHDMVLNFLALGPGDAIAELLFAHEPDAILCAGFFEPEVLEFLRLYGKPVALVDAQHPGIASVNPDNVTGAYRATQYLLQGGCRRIAFLGASLAHHSVRQREQGYRRALFDAGVLADPDLEVILPPGDIDVQVAIAVAKLRALPHPPDAIFAYNDVAALAALQACKKHGVAVPKDMAVIGFDDIERAALSQPALSTVAIDKSLLGIEGVRLLLNHAAAHFETVLPVQLRLRGSTRQIQGENHG